MSPNGRPKPVVLIVLDGWGYSETSPSNAIAAARTPVWDRLWSDYPHTLIRTSGAEVGLPADQMGNSEVGHLNLGAGRVVYQEFTRVDRAIKHGSFFTNDSLNEAIDQARDTGKAVHILGLLSPGGVHSHEEHVHAMVDLAVKRGVGKVYVHAFLDGRDTPPRSAEASLRLLEEKFETIGGGRLVSMVGRFYAMDRDHRWPRVQAAYDLMTLGKAEHEAPDALAALDMAYARGENDEFVQATRIVPPGGKPVVIEDGDAVVFMNYRSDRARQITRAFIEPGFDCFPRERHPQLAAFVTLTEYSADFDVPVAFPPERMRNVFGEYIANAGLHQLRIAETEKYAHVTFFFNGGREEPFPGEDRILIPSPQVSTYDQKPEMSAVELTDQLVAAIDAGRYDVIICNYANPDMVGHTGDMAATIRAIEALDDCLGRVHDAVRAAGGEMLITADHGNAEQMLGEDTGQPHTAHTSNPVPFIYVSRRPAELAATGALCDVAPTLLALMAMPQPEEMTGKSLMQLLEPAGEA
ncbi:MAG: 2,3-bisphosphoglycerate-independent phosphoglycerate mutase [Gammaproteobacteria bacterium]|nr:2,3-bisphosphoglycerate-independent phosphoglycerate mutase [Gammaproteobacteria bacterium]